MKSIVYFLSIIGLVIVLEASEGPSRATAAMVRLVSSDGKEFTLPLAAVQELPVYAEYLQEHGAATIAIPGEILGEIVQVMEMFYRYRNLPREQLIKKAAAEIRIADNYAFAATVSHFNFEPGIEVITEKYEKSDDDSLPKSEYEYYMKLIQELNPQAYEKLRKCELTTGKPCIRLASDMEVESDDVTEEPLILINPAIKLWGEKARRDMLAYYIDEFESYSPTTVEERARILDAIKELAPALYSLLVADDPTGLKHVKRDLGTYNARIRAARDGLPRIEVTDDLITLPKGELYYVLAHELSHYVLQHAVKDPIPSMSEALAVHEQRTAEIKERSAAHADKKAVIKVPRVSGQLPFKESFKKAYSRGIEMEADRFAVMEFGASIDDAIAHQVRGEETMDSASASAIKKETFKRTHPLAQARIKQFKDLRTEVELNKARGIKPKPIDWEGLAEFYKNEWKRLGLS